MESVEQWLEPYRVYLSTAAFLEAVREAEPVAPAEDPQAFFDDLLAPVDLFNLSTQIWTAQFLGSAGGEIQANPAAIVEFCLERLHQTSTVPAAEAAALAEACFKLGRNRAGEVAAATSYLAGGRSMRCLALLAGMAIRQGRIAEARALVEEAVGLYGELPVLRFARALSWLGDGEVPGALDDLRGLCDEEPSYRPAWDLIVELLLTQERWAEAAGFAQRASERFGFDPKTWERLARAHVGEGRHGEALAALKRALEAVEQSVDPQPDTKLRLRLKAAALHRELGRPERALEICRSLSASGETAPEVFLHTAVCLMSLRRQDEALETLRRGVEAHPDCPELGSALGEALFEVGSDGEAFEALQRAVETDPGRTADLLLMAILCLRNRRPEAAIELAEGVARRDGGRAAEALVIIGDAHRFRGAGEAALSSYLAALELRPGIPEVLERVETVKKTSGPH